MLKNSIFDINVTEDELAVDSQEKCVSVIPIEVKLNKVEALQSQKSICRLSDAFRQTIKKLSFGLSILTSSNGLRCLTLFHKYGDIHPFKTFSHERRGKAKQKEANALKEE